MINKELQPVNVKEKVRAYLSAALTPAAYFTRFFSAILVLNALLLVLWRISAGSEFAVVHFITDENGILEISQGVLFILSAAICFHSAASPLRTTVGSRINSAMGLFFIMLFLRETDIDAFGSSPNWERLEIIIRVSVAIAAVLFCILSHRQIIHALRRWRILIFSFSAWMLLLGCIFYALGWPFDKNTFDLPISLALMLEETLELDACISYLCSACLAGQQKDAINLI